MIHSNSFPFFEVNLRMENLEIGKCYKLKRITGKTITFQFTAFSNEGRGIEFKQFHEQCITLGGIYVLNDAEINSIKEIANPSNS